MHPCNFFCLNREIQGGSHDRLHHQSEAAAGGGRCIHFLGCIGFVDDIYIACMTIVSEEPCATQLEHPCCLNQLCFTYLSTLHAYGAQVSNTLCLTYFCHSVFPQHPTGNRQGKGAPLRNSSSFFVCKVLSFQTKICM